MVIFNCRHRPILPSKATRGQAGASVPGPFSRSRQAPCHGRARQCTACRLQNKLMNDCMRRHMTDDHHGEVRWVASRLPPPEPPRARALAAGGRILTWASRVCAGSRGCWRGRPQRRRERRERRQRGRPKRRRRMPPQKRRAGSPRTLRGHSGAVARTAAGQATAAQRCSDRCFLTQINKAQGTEGPLAPRLQLLGRTTTPPSSPRETKCPSA
jgi:hypothetical protein